MEEVRRDLYQHGQKVWQDKVRAVVELENGKLDSSGAGKQYRNGRSGERSDTFRASSSDRTGGCKFLTLQHARNVGRRERRRICPSGDVWE